ncbi:hypothetical protein MNBD_GAMMA10-2282 [hydrothermal vent metagenome]|uniref:GDPGP1-like N-terminal domain-containing protein n=1 Tax=hydrothermal vent metagenome TaxID=652676 RepID=A0A3B0XD00_9ZZZZ
MMNRVFSSLDYFRQQFNQGLFELLDKRQLGTFILCLANASNDEQLLLQMKPALQAQYQMLLQQFGDALASGRQPGVVEEDLLVFLKLHTLGFDNIQLTQQRSVSEWRCQFNQLRSFRPTRMSGFEHQGENFTPYIATEFNFNKPFMSRECFCSGKYLGRQLDLFYNKYPFADLHGLLVPDREACLPQFLPEEMHQYIWQVSEQLAQSIDGVGIGYNSYGAYASVNHLHFQMFIEPQGLPVSHGRWQHNGGETAYPLKLIKSTDSRQAWAFIEQLHAEKQPYNLLYMPGEVYIMPRQCQASVEVPDWSSGFTWYELSGAMLCSNQPDYSALRAENIHAYIRQVSS